MSDLADLSDGALVEALRGQNLDALGILFDRYYTQLYRTALAILHDEAAAEDVVQDCFLRLHRYAERIDTSLSLLPWLYRVTVNLSYTWVTRRQRKRISLEGLIDQLMSPASQSPDQMMEIRDMQQRVRAAVSTLPLNQKIVIVLHYQNGLSVEEIADVVECPVGTVKSRLYYARETLRRALGDTMMMGELAHGYAGFTG
jgi:RNA polymerase sigma-70 factor (ECF subfamily)